MSDPVPAVSEAGATGDIADIFADIRHVYQVGVVNLIWRHLATFPGALPWVWQLVKPVYVDGTIEREAAGLRASIAFPDFRQNYRVETKRRNISRQALSSSLLFHVAPSQWSKQPTMIQILFAGSE